jgi:integrase/recombinase XerD
MPLNMFRRHTRKCLQMQKQTKAVKTGREYTKCNCPLAYDGYVGNIFYKPTSLGLRNWETAKAKLNEIEAAAAFPERYKPDVTVTYTVERFLSDCEIRKLTESTMSKYRTLTGQLKTFCSDKGIKSIRQLDPDTLSAFRETWDEEPISALKKFERLRSFFKFCHGRKWIDDNPALALKAPKADPKPKMPFTKDEIEKILWACELFSTTSRYRSKQRDRIKAVVLLMRYSGIAIQDAVTLKRDRLTGNKLFLRRAKTGVPVTVTLPDHVVAALNERAEFQDRFFWSGNGKVTTVVKVWEDTFRRLFEIAGIEDGQSHRFRDTFAVELLLTGARIDQVAALLGNSPRIVEKHYAPWVQERQDQLEEVVKRAW